MPSINIEVQGKAITVIRRKFMQQLHRYKESVAGRWPVISGDPVQVLWFHPRPANKGATSGSESGSLEALKLSVKVLSRLSLSRVGLRTMKMFHLPSKEAQVK